MVFNIYGAGLCYNIRLSFHTTFRTFHNYCKNQDWTTKCIFKTVLTVCLHPEQKHNQRLHVSLYIFIEASVTEINITFCIIRTGNYLMD